MMDDGGEVRRKNMFFLMFCSIRIKRLEIFIFFFFFYCKNEILQSFFCSPYVCVTIEKYFYLIFNR